MTERDPKFAELFETFLDGSLDNDAQREKVASEIESNPELGEQVELQDRIDDWTRRLYAPPADLDIVPPELKDAEVPSPLNEESAKRSRRRKILWLALAASAAWIMVALNLSGSNKDVAAFQPKPLTQVFQDCVNEGFEPYWVCDDDFVFATTFNRRQGVPLKLEELPEGREMVGLSYLAGISRRSTSMLANVDGRSVIVFVDRLDRDWHPETGFFEEEELYVLRREGLGLVFYEVTPFEQIKVADSFVEANIEKLGETVE